MVKYPRLLYLGTPEARGKPEFLNKNINNENIKNAYSVLCSQR